MNYVAVYLPSTIRDVADEGGFDSEEEAWKWIGENGLCRTCQNDLARGYELWPDLDEYGNEIEVITEIKSVAHTMCGAEWCVITEEEWKSLEDLADVIKSMAEKCPEEKNE